MKKFKKIASLALVIIMMLALVIPALAADATGSITISNARPGETYGIYKILNLDSYDDEKNAYLYTVVDAWEDFFKTGAGADYVDIDATYGNVTWKADKQSASDLQEFASAALAYAADNSITATDKTAGAAAEGADTVEVKFENLELGYYLVESSLGTLCALNTTNPDATVREKNSTSTLNKTVEDEKTGTINSYDIGDSVNFKLDITVEPPEGVEAEGTVKNFVIHDKMSESLTFDAATAGIKVSINDTEISADATINVAGEDVPRYTVVTTGLTDGCTFEIQFADGAVASKDKITVTYSATLNEKALEEGATNEAHTNTDLQVSPPSVVEVYTATIVVDKFAAGEETKKLAGAKFVLKNEAGKYYKYTAATETVAAYVEWVENKDDATEVITDANGAAQFDGLKVGTYFLEETEAPAGYNKLTSDITVTIAVPEVEEGETPDYHITQVEKVSNNTGTILPITGGMGTTLFIAFGAIVVLGTGVILVTRRRVSMMNNED